MTVLTTIMSTVTRASVVSGQRSSSQCEGLRVKQGKFLLLDSRIIESTQNADLTIGTIKKHPANPLFQEDKPWEPRFDNVYADIIYDEDDQLYKCWYNPFIIDQFVAMTAPENRNPNRVSYKASSREIAVCYALSKDGICWEKPELDLVEFAGSKKNNIVMRPETLISGSAVAVFKDTSDSNPARRYKMLLGGHKNQMGVAFSLDGLNWSEPIRTPEIGGCGAQPTAFWAPDLRKYVGISRDSSDPPPGVRRITRTESRDFVHWTIAKPILQGPNHRLQTHDMTVIPTCGVYLGLVGVMEFPGDSADYSPDCVKQHCELAWSPDSVAWHRIQEGTPFIGHTPGKDERYGAMPYDWGGIFAADPIFLENEVRIYYGSSDWYFFDWRKGSFALAILRPDGWAGYEPNSKDTPAVVTTKLLKGSFATLSITADVKIGGSVHVTVVDEEGEELAHAQPVTETVTDAKIRWDAGWGVHATGTREIQLKFVLHNAKLYAFQL